MNLLNYLIPFVLALGLLILVHELGHYLVARWCGVKVLRFSLGFGKPLLVRKAGRDQTEWALAAFPLGGYVKMLDEREAPVAPAELHRAFNRQSVYRRFAIVAAGPIANFLLAIVVFAALTTWLALLALLGLVLLMDPLRRVLGGAVGRDLIPVLQATGFAEIVVGLGLLVGVLL